MAPGYCYHATGPFTLRARLVNRAPDSVDARVAVGDTIDGEAVDFPGDVDEFLFSGTMGQRVNVVLRAGRPIYADGALTLELVDPTTSAILGTVSATWRDAETGAVELSATRDYLVRVRGVRDTHDGAMYSVILQAAQ
jgi:hypothetical protein